MFNKKQFNLSALLVLAFLACIVALNYFTPMHSDDYHYKMMGLGLQTHVDHYVSWSGRFLADYISPLLLSIENKFVLALIQTSGLFILCYTISRSTRFVRTGAEPQRFESWLTLFVLAFFFLSVPVFTQVALWVVGSANYLWTAVLYSCFIYIVLRYVYTRRIPFYAYPLALLAGCTNESAAATILAFAGLTLVWFTVKSRKIDFRFVALLVCFAIGAAVLVGAPGNQARLAHDYFQDWVNLSFGEKLWLHFSDRMVRPLEQSSVPYALALFFLWKAFRNKKPWLNTDGTPAAKALFVVFFVMAWFATAVMALSPTMPPRSLTVSFVFLLFSLVFGVVMLVESGARIKHFHYGLVLLTCVSAFYLSMLLPAFKSLHAQEKVRVSLFEQASPHDVVEIPDFQMRFLPVKNRRMYLLDGYVNTEAMAKFYGVESVKIL